MLRIKDVNLVACLNICDSVLLLPALMIFDSFLESLSLVVVSSSALAVNQVLDRVIDNLRLMQDPLSDVLTAVRALFLSDKAFSDALLAEGMSANCCPAADNVVHANRAHQPIQLRKRLFETLIKLKHGEFTFFDRSNLVLCLFH